MTHRPRRPRDGERIARLRQGMEEAGLDALVCALPANVLLLTGYWPVLGTAIAVATREGGIGLAAPEDEGELASLAWAEPLELFQPASLSELCSTVAGVRGALQKCLRALGVSRARIGWEATASFEPAPYVAFNLYGTAVADLCRELVPGGGIESADQLLRRLRGRPTRLEGERIRLACEIAGQAFRTVEPIRRGLTEAEVAAAFRRQLLLEGDAAAVQRADGSIWCMAGPNSARAHRSYARTYGRRIAPGELVLIHCNSVADGFWTDITRTYTVAPRSERQDRLYEAVFAARAAALAAIRPGAAAAAVDRAARDALDSRGLGHAFKHPTGHGVGFSAIDHHALPRLHSASSDVLEAGMIFNVEPGVYFDQEGGLRHCDVVAVTDKGADVLTPFHCSPKSL